MGWIYVKTAENEILAGAYDYHIAVPAASDFGIFCLPGIKAKVFFPSISTYWSSWHDLWGWGGRFFIT